MKPRNCKERVEDEFVTEAELRSLDAPERLGKWIRGEGEACGSDKMVEELQIDEIH